MLNSLQRGLDHRFIIQQLVGLFGNQQVIAVSHAQLFAGFAGPECLAEQIADIHPTRHHPGLARHLKRRHRVRGIGDLQLDDRVIQLSGFQLFAEHVARRLAGVHTGNRGNHPVLGRFLRPGFHILAHLFAGLGDGDIHQVADDLIDIPANIAHFGKFRRLNLEERRTGQFCQTAADLGLAHACRPDHQDILGIDLVA